MVVDKGSIIMHICHAHKQLPKTRGSSWSWLHGSSIWNYLCNQCLSPLTWCVPYSLKARHDKYNIMWCSLSGLWFSSDTPISSIHKTDRHDIAGIVLKVALFFAKNILIVLCMSKTSYILIHAFIFYISVHSICYEHIAIVIPWTPTVTMFSE